MLNSEVQNVVGTQTNSVVVLFSLEIRMHVWIAKDRIPSEEAKDIPVTIALYDGLEDALPILCAMHIPLAEKAP